MAKLRHIVMKAEPGRFGVESPTVQKARLPLNCGRCDNRTFAVIVEPEGQMARAIGVECAKCGNGWFLDDHAYVKTSGEITPDKSFLENMPKGANGNGSVQ